jgi:glycerophosphoryl diester phosphodiesterase
MLDRFPRPILLAHRGDNKHAPENTLPAFSQAVQKGADGIELDAKLTVDGHVIVIHDETVDRTTDGKGAVASLTLEAIRKLDAGSWKDSRFAGTKVPLLEEVFETLGKDKLINIELTNYFTPRDSLVGKVCELIQRHNNAGQIIFSSFSPFNLKTAAGLMPNIPRGLLASPGLLGLWARSFGFMFGDYQALHPHVTSVSREQIQRTRRVKRRVHVWTANEPGDIRRLRDWDVDGIITDDPAVAVKALGR